MQSWHFLPKGSDLTETKTNKTPLNINNCPLLGLFQKLNITGANDELSLQLFVKACAKFISNSLSKGRVLVQTVLLHMVLPCSSEGFDPRGK